MEKLCKIRDIQRAIILFETKLEKQYGICLNEGMALCSLHKATTLSSGEIGELLGLTPSNTSKVIASIERKGYVERVLGTTDKRQMHFSLTTQGATKLAQIECSDIELPDALESVINI